jgi:hypothetical protein
VWRWAAPAVDEARDDVLRPRADEPGQHSVQVGTPMGTPWVLVLGVRVWGQGYSHVAGVLTLVRTWVM